MKRSWALPVIAAFLLFATQGILNAQTTFHASGEFGETFANVNGTQLTVFAARGCTGLPCITSNTILVVDAFTLTPSGSVFTSGAGVIPDSAFQADSPEHATLNIDTSQVPDFQITSCTFVPGSGFVCQPGSLGVIQIEWHRTQTSVNNRLETDHITSGPFVTDTHQNQDFFSAAATGSYLGTNFSDRLRSTIGTNKETTITRTTTQN